MILADPVAVRSTTATALFPPLATNNVFSSSDQATAFDALPKGSAGSGRTAIVSRTDLDAVSMTETVSELALATKRVVPSLVRARPAGWRPTGIYVGEVEGVELSPEDVALDAEGRVGLILVFAGAGVFYDPG